MPEKIKITNIYQQNHNGNVAFSYDPTNGKIYGLEGEIFSSNYTAFNNIFADVLSEVNYSKNLIRSIDQTRGDILLDTKY